MAPSVYGKIRLAACADPRQVNHGSPWPSKPSGHGNLRSLPSQEKLKGTAMMSLAHQILTVATLLAGRLNQISPSARFVRSKFLRLHMRRIHPDEYFAGEKAAASATKHARWSDIEIERTARLELQLVNVRYINIELSKHMPGSGGY